APAQDVADDAPRAAPDDEGAAMRAIEGGWTPRATVAPEQPAPEPELDPAEIEAAISAARSAVANAAAAAQTALAEATAANDVMPEEPAPAPVPELLFEVSEARSPEGFLETVKTQAAPMPEGMDFEPERPIGAFGRPQGLPTPRDGGRDNLRQIRGVSPEIEHAMNQLGIFHFDQVADLDHKGMVWLDQHLSLRGRMTREKWIEQARSLAS